jgi:hypothetical protein
MEGLGITLGEAAASPEREEPAFWMGRRSGLAKHGLFVAIRAELAAQAGPALTSMAALNS